MSPIVPQVHLLICFDERVSPGVVLQSLDILRTKEWQNETVLVCDESWRPFVNVDQAIIFVDRAELTKLSSEKDLTQSFELVLDQLDNFEIVEVTQIGQLNWGRWISSYFDHSSDIKRNSVQWNSSELSAIQVINELCDELSIDPTSPCSSQLKSQAVYIDPYIDGQISPIFRDMVARIESGMWPAWLQIVATKEDQEFLQAQGLGNHLVDINETEISLFNQSVLCFSEDSKFFQTSRAYNVAIIGKDKYKSLFMPGDINICMSQPSHPLELFNVLSYWKSNRLRELAFQWLNMGIDVWVVESTHGQLLSRNLLNYSSDLFHAQNLVSEFLQKGSEIKRFELRDLVGILRNGNSENPYSLAFSLKLLVMIVDRMIVSANSGERLFHRLGSDYHRIIIGEALIEGLIEANSQRLDDLNVPQKLKDFRNFLIKVDTYNDEFDYRAKHKESR